VIVDARPRSLASGGNGRASRVRHWLETVNGGRAATVKRVA
jgi:hypothetical protein